MRWPWDVTSRFELSDGVKGASCLAVESLAQNQSCYLTLKPLFDETGNTYALKFRSTNNNQINQLTLPAYTSNGIQPNAEVNPETIIKQKNYHCTLPSHHRSLEFSMALN